jgi:superfamily II DNA or RNA helicase
MASEGFNVPRLNCLVFATPRSNITQSIGRIYRKTHNRPPIIVDIVDNFSIFSRQQYARRKIYKKNIKQNTGIEIDDEEICLIEE